MSKFIRRVLSLLFKFGFYTKHYKITYTGEIASTNKFYASPHWSQRSSAKNKYAKIFSLLLLEAKVAPLKQFSLIVFANTRIDIDNHIQNKFLIDTMKGKYVVDDSKKFYQMTMTIHDDSLPKNTIEYHIIGT